MNESGLSEITLIDTSASTYWCKKDLKSEIFRIIEPVVNMH
jgi:hypothetical protein